MAEEKQLKEAQVAYGAASPDLVEPIILKRDGEPVFAVLPFEEYRRLRDMASTEHQRRQAAWARLNALLEEVHSRPTDLTPEEIEVEITTAREEVKEMHRARRGGR
jgi:PHD/YefM family antitoxin component YafN of YafNO toxin-antitoxin module